MQPHHKQLRQMSQWKLYFMLREILIIRISSDYTRNVRSRSSNLSTIYFWQWKIAQRKNVYREKALKHCK